MENSHHQNCPFCKWVVERPKYVIKENESYLSLVNTSPNSESHVLIITKEPRTNITELTKEEWSNLLLILKITINKITNAFRPRGFNIYINTGTEGAACQAVFHFHLQVVPEWKGNWGAGYLRKPRFIPSSQSYEEIEKTLQTDQKVIGKNDKAIAKLIDREQASDCGHIIVSSKEPDNGDLNQTDVGTWNQMGELLRESIKKIEQKLNPVSFRTCLFLGEIGGLQRTSQLQIHLIPRYKSQGHKSEEVIPIPPEVLEVAETLRETESEPLLIKIPTHVDMDVDKPTGSENPLPLEDEVKKASKEQLINLKKWIEAELAIREKQAQIEVPSEK